MKGAGAQGTTSLFIVQKLLVHLMCLNSNYTVGKEYNGLMQDVFELLSLFLCLL